MVRRAKEPAKGTLDLPGGFVDMGETVEQGMIREIKEETGLDVEEIQYLFSSPNVYMYSGMGVHTLFNQGCTGCMVYVDHQGAVSPLYLKDLQDPVTGKIPPRLVNVNSNKVMSYVNDIMDYITPADYEAAKKYLPNPADYDFKRMLNW